MVWNAEAVGFSEFRDRLSGYLDECSRTGRRFAVGRHSKTEAYLISKAEWEEIVATLEVLSDPSLLEQIAQSERDIQRGRVYPVEDVMRELLTEDE